MQHSQAIIGGKPLPAAYEQEVQGVLSVSSLQDRVVRAMLSIVPSDGSTIGNTALRRELEKQLQAEGLAIGDDDYWQAHSALVADGALVKGQGRGGSVRLAQMDRLGPLAGSPRVLQSGNAPAVSRTATARWRE